MQVPDPVVIEARAFEEGAESVLAEVPNSDAVFVVWAGERSAYLAKTSMLRRRLMRIFKASEPGGAVRRSLNLRAVATRVDYWLTGSKFESLLVHYALARRFYPDDYLRLIKLRMPSYVRLVLANDFPRTQVSTRLSASRAIHYGPFASRAAAELFQDQFLDLFQLRRCQENLEPSPEHPGCIYGEMGKCLRPCQQVVSIDEYRSEAARVAQFLETNGALALSTAEAARDRLSEELNFEEASRQHKRIERIQAVLSLRDDLVRDIDRLYTVVIVPSIVADAVSLWFCCRGTWQDPVEFSLTSDVSLDRRLRDLIGTLHPQAAKLSDREEHLALLARWAYSSWRDGEILVFEDLENAPYRKMVRAISRVHPAHKIADPT